VLRLLAVAVSSPDMSSAAGPAVAPPEGGFARVFDCGARPGVSGGCIRVHPNDIYFLLDAIEDYPTGVYVLDRPWVRSR